MSAPGPGERPAWGLRRRLGAILLDVPRFAWHVGSRWVLVRNRRERIERSPDGSGVRCLWAWTSELHVANVFPALGRLLLRRALVAHPVVLGRAAPAAPAAGAARPRVSFVIGHRGAQRRGLLEATLRSIAAQQFPDVETIVVEQSGAGEADGPPVPGVRWIATPPPEPELPFCRSWAFNVGARAARGELLVFHDNDMLVPTTYAGDLWRLYAQGFEVLNLKRFVFYLSAGHSREILDSGRVTAGRPPDAVVQNLEAGGSVAIGREAFAAIGGFDELFVGWGGEDNEFWERAQTRRTWPYGTLPILHLWHEPQPGKRDGAGGGVERYRGLAASDPGERIRALRARDQGLTAGPWREADAAVAGASAGAGGAGAAAEVAGLVSTVIPVHNRPQQLAEAVESVLAQSHRPVEVVVVDDGSTDDTPAVAAALAARHPEVVRVLRQANAGPGRAREAGRLAARGEFVQYLDSDDLLLPGKFERQVAGLRAGPQFAASYGWTRFRRADGTVVPGPLKGTGRREERIFPAMLASRWWSTSTPLFRASLLRRAGPWTDLRLEEDWEYDCRVAALGGDLHYVPEYVSEMRDHGGERLCRGAALDPARLRDRARAHRLILGHARRAGIGEAAPEMVRFARELFLLARQCGAAGLAGESRELFALAREASGPVRAAGADFRLYRALAGVVGWKAAGRLACFSDRFRPAPPAPPDGP